ncbi:hypothetical protein [Desulfosporosinus youngiae]|uniref:Uncharacterized protein n=1 Tax=Desulfosporosinus youngiae DSM 17734 TaxID=768710 RepID=H5XTJ2_9FIRM|nr:hypothetical protein [Desulfosporosinus youngiae]EHQ88591.1 hypothetical protein DesyoDRAFT_1434 [Desulfosporosinus youngiae DSM 17734]
MAIITVAMTMVLFYILVFIFGEPISSAIFLNRGGPDSYYHPIYLGIIVLSGLIVGCTYYLAKLIKGL